VSGAVDDQVDADHRIDDVIVDDEVVGVLDERPAMCGGMLAAPGPSCVSPPPQLKREWSPWPEFGSDLGNPRELSKG